MNPKGTIPEDRLYDYDLAQTQPYKFRPIGIWNESPECPPDCFYVVPDEMYAFTSDGAWWFRNGKWQKVTVTHLERLRGLWLRLLHRCGQCNQEIHKIIDQLWKRS